LPEQTHYPRLGWRWPRDRARSSNTVTVSWQGPSTGFVLESTPSLSPPDWKKADEVATPNNGRLEVTVSADQGSRYFRLRKP